MGLDNIFHNKVMKSLVYNKFNDNETVNNNFV